MSCTRQLHAVASCLVSTEWAVYRLLSYNWVQKMLLSSCRGSIPGNIGSLQSGQAFAGQKALAVQSLLLIGCDKGHKPAKNG